MRWRGTTANGLPAAHIGDDRCYLALFQATSDQPARQDYDAVGVNHFGFVVSDLAESRSRLAELGVTPTAEADYEPGRRLYFLDRDGIEVELVEYDDKEDDKDIDAVGGRWWRWDLPYITASMGAVSPARKATLRAVAAGRDRKAKWRADWSLLW